MRVEYKDWVYLKYGLWFKEGSMGWWWIFGGGSGLVEEEMD